MLSYLEQLCLLMDIYLNQTKRFIDYLKKNLMGPSDPASWYGTRDSSVI